MPIAISFRQGSRTSVGLGLSQGTRSQVNLGFTTGIGDITNFVLAETPTGAIDGGNEDFTTSQNFIKLWVYLNGVRMKPGQDYTVTNNHTFHFLYPPQTGDTLIVDYIT